MTLHTPKTIDPGKTLDYPMPGMDDWDFHEFVALGSSFEWWLDCDWRKVGDDDLWYCMTGYCPASPHILNSSMIAWIDAGDLYRAALKIATSGESNKAIAEFALTGCQYGLTANDCDRILQVAVYGRRVFSITRNGVQASSPAE